MLGGVIQWDTIRALKFVLGFLYHLPIFVELGIDVVVAHSLSHLEVSVHLWKFKVKENGGC